MKWNHRRKNTVDKSVRAATAIRQAIIEPLENRQLLSATVQITNSSGGLNITATKVGQVFTLDVYVVVAGSKPGDEDGFQSVTGSILGTPTGSGSIIGNMTGQQVTDDYGATSAQNGTSVDLNGDGGLDIGSNDNRYIAGFFYPRAGGIEQDGTIVGDSQSFLVGTFNYTVTKLNSGAATDVNFRARAAGAGAYSAVWEEDDNFVTDESATLKSGSPVVISNGAVATASIAGTVSKSVGGSTSGFSGVTVYLDNNNDGTFDSGDTSVVTGSTGAYSFTELAAGTYHLREVVPSGYAQTSPTSSPTNVTVSTGQKVTGDNFTDTAVTSGKASISGYTFNDANGDGKWESNEKPLAGVTVFLDTNKNGVLDSGEPSAVTNSSGAYSFTGLAAGTYKVQEVVPSGEKLTTVGSYTITLSTTTAAANKNFGNEATQAGNASISGTIDKVVSGVTSGFSGVTVYLDTNDNGVLDAGEPSTVTSSNGTYSFVGLAAGTYHVREQVPSGYSQTSPTSSPTTITLTAGQVVAGENFTDTAAATGKGSISGYVFDDANGDGKWESNEKAVSGVTIYIDANKNGVLDSGEVKVVTGSNGEYTFAGLAAGTYRIREVVPGGKKLTTVAYYDVTIPAGYNSMSKNFGNE